MPRSVRSRWCAGSKASRTFERLPSVLRAGSRARSVPALPHHEGPRELDHGLAGLIDARRLHAHDADLRPRLRFARLEHFAPRIYRVALEERIGQPHLVPAEIRD